MSQCIKAKWGPQHSHVIWVMRTEEKISQMQQTASDATLRSSPTWICRPHHCVGQEALNADIEAVTELDGAGCIEFGMDLVEFVELDSWPGYTT